MVKRHESLTCRTAGDGHSWPGLSLVSRLHRYYCGAEQEK
jgi:hypothetical protein